MKHIFKIGLATVLIVGGTAAAIWGWIQWRYDRLVVTEIAAAPEIPVAIVFGAGVRRRPAQPDAGRPDRHHRHALRRRQSAQIAGQRRQPLRGLRRAGTHVRLRRRPRRAAGQHGARLRRTAHLRHVYPAKAIFSVERALLVTQRFHLPRAIFTCRNLGVDGIGFSADRRPYWSNNYYRFRDAFATLRAWWDVKIAHPLPLLGPREEMGLETGS